MTQPSVEADVVGLSARLVTYGARLTRAMSRAAAPDIPAATLRLLAQLEELGPAGVSRLAQADRCSQPTMSTAVQGLVDRGWASKRPNPGDARASLVELTPAGQDVLTGARRRIGAIVAERLGSDPEHGLDDLAAAVSLLENLLHDQGDL